jgi:hypothetical protein
LRFLDLRISRIDLSFDDYPSSTITITFDKLSCIAVTTFIVSVVVLTAIFNFKEKDVEESRRVVVPMAENSFYGRPRWRPVSQHTLSISNSITFWA